MWPLKIIVFYAYTSSTNGIPHRLLVLSGAAASPGLAMWPRNLSGDSATTLCGWRILLSSVSGAAVSGCVFCTTGKHAEKKRTIPNRRCACQVVRMWGSAQMDPMILYHQYFNCGPHGGDLSWLFLTPFMARVSVTTQPKQALKHPLANLHAELLVAYLTSGEARAWTRLW